MTPTREELRKRINANLDELEEQRKRSDILGSKLGTINHQQTEVLNRCEELRKQIKADLEVLDTGLV